MKSNGEIYTPDEKDLRQLVPPYQEAFKREPWGEVSKCADDQLPKRCPGGLSRIAVGQVCTMCKLAPTRPAYEEDEIVERFSELRDTRSTVFYREVTGSGEAAFAAIAWRADATTIASDKYGDVPAMESWLREKFGEKEIVWLDEVFSDISVREKGNLTNFKAMLDGMMEELSCDIVAYRTISPAMVRVADRDFGLNAQIYKSEQGQVPDRRDFIIITRGETV